MATITYTLSRKADKAAGQNQILVRFVVGSRINQRAKSSIYAPAEYWNDKKQAVSVPTFRYFGPEQRALTDRLNGINTALQNLRAAITAAYLADGAGRATLPAGWLAGVIYKYNHPEEAEEAEAAPRLLADAFEDYLKEHHLSEYRIRFARVVSRALARFEAYTGERLELDSITPDTLRAFERFQREEASIVAARPDLLEVCPECREPEDRSENTIIGRMKMLRAVLNYAYKQGRTENKPFARYSISTAVYGTPYYISIEERNALYRLDLSARPELAVQRDIFVFQCLTGCRVSDLDKLTRANLVNGGIEYIPTKTKEERGAVVRVPLNATAREIVERYASDDRAALLPFIASQNYNKAIKEIFTLAGLTRRVTILDPKTRQEVQRPLNEIASSHLARRTFIGNLYKQVKDPNLIAKLSGHTEGSKAFARYRDIDEDMRIELVSMLEK